jgi:hypothetical protein
VNAARNGIAETKARLLLGGPVKVDPELLEGVKTSCSSAGPGAGRTSIILSSGEMRVRKAVSSEEWDFELVRGEGGFRLIDADGVLLDKVAIEPIVHHAPEQAFFNLDHRCIFGCRFCSAPMPWHTKVQPRALHEVTRKMIEAREAGTMVAALTSGVPDNPRKTVARMASVVRDVLREAPDMMIGVEPYVSCRKQIEQLHAAGASEIKINLEAADATIFAKVCPRKDQELLLDMIDEACDVFGRGHVASNILIGMGENDKVVLEAVEVLASMGCVPTLRPLQVGISNRKSLEDALGVIPAITPSRMVSLARQQGVILEREGLTPKSFSSMCHKCGCCDLRPFIDV